MAFIGSTFLFDGVCCDYYGLQLYSFENNTLEEANSGSKLEIIEDRTSRSIFPIYYSCEQKEPLTFELTCGSEIYLDKYDIDLIVSWLTEKNGYKYLEIIQDDLSNVRYRCIIQDVKNIHITGKPVAFKCGIVCDSSYAYGYPTAVTNQVVDSLDIQLFNDSNVKKLIYPTLTIQTNSTKEIKIINQSDSNRETIFSNLPNKDIQILIDNQKQIITADTGDNLYSNFNGNFLRIKDGVNSLKIVGNCTVSICYESLKKVGA